MSGDKKKIANTQYTAFYGTWEKMRDVFKGEEHMKDKSLSQNEQYLDGNSQLTPIKSFDQYLRPTDSQRRLGDLGLQRFCDYIYRAKFYPFPQEIHSQSLGLIENQPATFELPSKMEGMIEDATTDNESLTKVLSKINTNQLQVSRVGLLLSPSNEEDKPFNIALYGAETIVDWKYQPADNSDNQLVWVKLLSGEVDDNDKPIYLILMLDEKGTYIQYKTINQHVAYGDNPAMDEEMIVDSMTVPTSAEKPLDVVPFVIVNTCTVGGDIERPFLESVADGSISLFRASAHYEDALYWGGESTLFTRGYGLGDDGNIYIGNGASNKTNTEYAQAQYVTMGTDGIEPRQTNVEKLFEYCVSLGVDLINQGAESGVSLNIRSNVKTASLKTLSMTGAEGVEVILGIGAYWLGIDADQVVVTANTTFADVAYTADDFQKFASMVAVGAMRAMDLYTLQKRNRITSAETLKEWQNDLEKQGDDSNGENSL